VLGLKAVLFDLEGTLVESIYQQAPETIEQLRRETKARLIELGVPPDLLRGLVRSHALRNTSYQWAEENLSREEADKLRADVEEFMRGYDINSAGRTVLYLDTLGCLEELRDAGVEMGIVTNTSSYVADYVLGNLGIGGFFTAVATRSDVPRLKPDPAMVNFAASKMKGRVEWLVGDSVFDAGAAENSGLKSIMVKRSGLPPGFRHDFFVDSLSKVSAIILDGGF